MGQVTATLRLRKIFFESNPMYSDWGDMAITKVMFNIASVSGEKSIQTVEGKIGTDYITANALLEQDTDYKVWATAYSPFHPKGIDSDPITIQSGDVTQYYNWHAFIKDSATGEAIEGATLTVDPAGANEKILTSRSDGLVWFQRLPAGTYSYTLSKAGYDTVNGTITLGSLTTSGRTILMTLTV